MLFHSTEFLFVFLPITWLGFVWLDRLGQSWGKVAWLTAASLVFYAHWNPAYLWLLVTSILANFWIGRLVCPASTLSPAWRSALLVAGLVGNLGALAYFKYANFFVDNLNLALGTAFNIERVLLPLAISFFTFQQIAYVVDAFRGGSSRYGFMEYAFFVSFFPQLIAGPIVHHHEVIPQIERDRWRPLGWEHLQVGATIFVIGLFKKMVIADGCAEYATPLFEVAATGTVLSTASAWTAALGYSFQLYFDFSGYSDMATGLARVFGIVLPLNFNSPYRATSVIEFWRRWHMTLSRFLREYLYIPLGGNRRGVTLRYANLMITMLLGGLWHGAGWTFVAWGALHGGFLVANHLVRSVTAPFFERTPIRARIAGAFGWAVTMLAVVIGWVFFRAPDIGTAITMLESMFPFTPPQAPPLQGWTAQILSDNSHVWWLGFVSTVVLFAPSTQQYLRQYTPALEMSSVGASEFFPRWRPTFVHGFAVGCLVFLSARQYFSLAPTEFLYFNF